MPATTRPAWQERIYDAWLHTVQAAQAAEMANRPVTPDPRPPIPNALVSPWDSHHLYLGPNPELLLLSRAPTPTQVRQFQTGAADFHLHLSTRILVLTFRFGTLPWAMAPWGLWENPHDPTDYLLPGGLNDPVPIRIRLLRPDQGVIAERLVTWPAGFAGTVRIAIRSALNMGCHPEYAYSDLVRMLREHPNPEVLAASTAQAFADLSHEFTYTEKA